MSGWTTLVQAETLSIALGRSDLAIVDSRFSLANPGAGESASASIASARTSAIITTSRQSGAA